MKRRTTHAPAAPPARPILFRVLDTLERSDGAGFHWPGDILEAGQVRETSLLILLERGVIMFAIDPAQLAALPDHD